MEKNFQCPISTVPNIELVGVIFIYVTISVTTYLNFIFLDRFLFELLQKQGNTETHTDSDKYSIKRNCNDHISQRVGDLGAELIST